MKLTFKREAFAKTLLFVRNAIPQKEVEPVLNNIDIKAISKESVQIVTTDLDLMSVATCPVTVEGFDESEGAKNEMLIPAQRLLSLINKLTGDTIIFDQTDEATINISCGKYKADFKTQSSEGYPDVYAIANTDALTSFKRETLLAGFKRIDFAVNEDEAKKQLMAVQVSRNGMVASNGKVTAIYKESFDVDELCISSNCLKDLIAVMSASGAEDVQIFEEEAYLVFKFGNDIFFTRKTQVNFPEVFKRLDAPTAEKNKEILKFKVKDLKAVLQRVSLTASEETRSVIFDVITNDTLKISARDNKDFYSEETMSYTPDGIELDPEQPLQLAFNYDILLEVLSKMAGEDIEFKLNIANIRTPVRVEEGKLVILLMRSVI